MFVFKKRKFCGRVGLGLLFGWEDVQLQDHWGGGGNQGHLDFYIHIRLQVVYACLMSFKALISKHRV